MRFFKYILIFFILIGHHSNGQLTTNNAKTPEQLVRNVLAGGGVEISNVTYTGESTSIGEFNGAASNLGLKSGVILSSGTVLNELTAAGLQLGPMGPNNNSGASNSYGNPGDADLAALVSGVSKDAAVLEFDFVPEGDTIRFRYVFASEEYPEWVNNSFNDVFGFFISGAGIVGKKNIALLPDNVTSVNIKNVNVGVNSAYYISNGSGAIGTPQFTDNKVINFDGFTVVLEAVSVVQPCQTYHLKLAVSDIYDDGFNSAVFLEASSLYSAPKFKLEQGVDFSPTGSSNSLFEACSNGQLKISREQNLSSVLNIPFKIYGTATSGVDYQTITELVTFSPGESEKIVSINTIDDVIAEGDETIILRFKNPSVCENDSISITYTIKDKTLLSTKTGNDSVTCPGETIQISADVTSGIPTYTYAWVGSTATSSSITVSPLSTTFYKYQVTDACGQTSVDSVEVNVPIYAPLNVLPMTDKTIRCPGTILDFKVEPNGGAGNYTFLWNTGDQTQEINSQILVNSTISVEVTDQCGNKTTDDVEVTLNYPIFTALAYSDTTICYGEEIELSGTASGGIPPYNYFWNGQSGQVYQQTGVRTTAMYFSVYDSCAIIPAIDTVNVEVQKPTARFEINAPLPEPQQVISMINLSAGASSYFWDFGNREDSELFQPKTKYLDTGQYVITLIAIDDLSCRDTSILNLKIVPPFYLYFPNAFTPDGNDINDTYGVVGAGITNFSLKIFNRWGNEVFSTTDPGVLWDGNLPSGQPAPMDVYVVKYMASSYFRPDKKYEGISSVTLVR